MKLEKIIDRRELEEKSKELGKRLAGIYGDSDEIVFIGVLKGGFIFLSDLLKNYPYSVNVDFIRAKSYDGEVSGVIKLLYEPTVDLKNKTVILVEDIVDTGKTLVYLKKYILDKGAKKVLICSMINRMVEGRKINPDFSGFEVEDSRFLVGYGLDVDENFRNLPDVYAIDRESPDEK